MNQIKAIFKPKSNDEIKENLIQLVGPIDNTSKEDLDYLVKLYHMISFLKNEKSSGVITYMNFDDHSWSEDMEEIDLEDTPIFDYAQAYTQALTLNPYTKNININKKIKSWKKIYEKTIAMIIKNCDSLEGAPKNKYFTNQWSVINNFGFTSNLIAKRCRYGPASFAIVNSDFYKYRMDEFNNQNILKVIVDDTVKGKIIVGRKAGVTEAGIFLTKYKNKYSLDSIGIIKNNYISIDVRA